MADQNETSQIEVIEVIEVNEVNMIKGIEYATDYSANYTNRSLVDKVYIHDLTVYTLHKFKFFNIIDDKKTRGI